MISLSVITPTIGRPSLERTLNSIVPQLVPPDEVLVVADGERELARQICEKFKHVRYIETEYKRQWGNPQRDAGISAARTTHLAFCDDDDIFFPWAVEIIKGVASSYPHALLIFKSEANGYAVPHKYLWHDPMIRKGNIMSCSLVVPVRSDLPLWSQSQDVYAADHYFAQQCAHICEVIWREELIAKTRPS